MQGSAGVGEGVSFYQRWHWRGLCSEQEFIFLDLFLLKPYVF